MYLQVQPLFQGLSTIATLVNIITTVKCFITWPQNAKTAHCLYTITKQHAKKVLSDSLGLVNFAIGLSSVLKLPDGQTTFLQGIQITKEWQSNQVIKKLVFVLAEMTSGQENASYSLPFEKLPSIVISVFILQFPMAQLHCTFRAQECWIVK